jgi:hypothetical protein
MVGGGGIRICDFRFIRRGSQLIELPLGDFFFFFFNIILTFYFFTKVKTNHKKGITVTPPAR